MPAVEQDSVNGMEKLVLRTPQGASAEVYLHGAHITSWKTSDGKDVLFTSKQAVFKPPKAIRGGVPVCFPQFAQLGPLGQHGFARNSRFEVAQSDEASAMLVLTSKGEEDAKYPHPFELKITVALREDTLEQELSVTNTGTSPLEFTAALHTYFAISSISAVRVEGLEGATYSDSLQGSKRIEQQGPVTFDQEVDRIYLQAPASIKIIDEGNSTVEVRKTNFPDAVVWNPWVDKSKSMADFGDEEYKHMLCIEPALALSGPKALAPGENWSGRQELRYAQA